MPMTMLAGVLLSNVVGKPVMDRTGLAGRYDLTIEMPTPDGGESIFTAVTVVNESFVKQYFAHENPIGKRFCGAHFSRIAAAWGLTPLGRL